MAKFDQKGPLRHFFLCVYVYVCVGEIAIVQDPIIRTEHKEFYVKKVLHHIIQQFGEDSSISGDLWVIQTRNIGQKDTIQKTEI